MKNSRWPTQLELMEYVDGALDPQRFLEIDQLVSQSGSLKREIAMLTMMRKSVASNISVLDRRFTSGVMTEILPPQKMSLWYRIADHSSNIFAMSMVLTMIGLALFTGPATPHREGTIIAKAMESYSSIVAEIFTRLGSHSRDLSLPVMNIGQNSSGKMILIATGIFFLLVIADEFLGNRFSRQRK